MIIQTIKNNNIKQTKKQKHKVDNNNKHEHIKHKQIIQKT